MYKANALTMVFQVSLLIDILTDVWSAANRAQDEVDPTKFERSLWKPASNFRR